MSKISEVFNKDVLAWTAEDRDLAVAYYKENRDKFKLINNRKTGDPKTGELKPKKVRAKKAKPVDQLDLDLTEKKTSDD
jgi:hypothetical protein